MTKLGQDTGRPVWFLLTDRPTDPVRWQRLMQGVRTARAQGAFVTAQVAGRPIGIMLGVDTALNPFSIRAELPGTAEAPCAERLARLQDPAVRATILADEPSAELVRRLTQFRTQITTRWDRMFVMGDPPDYEPEESSSIAAMAKRSNHTPAEVAYDYLAGGLDRFLFFPIVGYNEDNHDIIRTMLTSPETLLGLSDGGAHCSSISDASVPSWMLAHWGRDRKRGPGLPLELIVKRQTSETADFFGFADRGRLAPGLKADVNVIDFERPAAARAGNPLRPAGRRAPAGAAGRWLHRDIGVRHAGVRARAVHRRHAGQAGARRIVSASTPVGRSPAAGEGAVAQRARYVRWHAAQASPTTLTCAATRVGVAGLGELRQLGRRVRQVVRSLLEARSVATRPPAEPWCCGLPRCPSGTASGTA